MSDYTWRDAMGAIPYKPDAPVGDALAAARKKVDDWLLAFTEDPSLLNAVDHPEAVVRTYAAFSRDLDAYGAAARAAGAAEEQAQCLLDVCSFCRDGIPVERRDDGYWSHGLCVCSAHNIRARSPSSGTDQTKKGDEG